MTAPRRSPAALTFFGKPARCVDCYGQLGAGSRVRRRVLLGHTAARPLARLDAPADPPVARRADRHALGPSPQLSSVQLPWIGPNRPFPSAHMQVAAFLNALSHRRAVAAAAVRSRTQAAPCANPYVRARRLTRASVACLTCPAQRRGRYSCPTFSQAFWLCRPRSKGERARGGAHERDCFFPNPPCLPLAFPALATWCRRLP